MKFSFLFLFFSINVHSKEIIISILHALAIYLTLYVQVYLKTPSIYYLGKVNDGNYFNDVNF